MISHRQSVQMQDLREELAIECAQRMRTDSDSVRPYVDAIVDHLQDLYASSWIYIAARPRALPMAQIAAEIQSGVARKQICRRHKITYRTLQRIIAQLAA